MKKLPLGIQTFSQIRNEGMLYVDKTLLIKKLVDSYKYVFLSRPRRFGKSLLVSTIAEYFNSNLPLFKGLAVQDQLPESAFPVIRLDFSRLSYKRTSDLGATLIAAIRNEAGTGETEGELNLPAEVLVKAVTRLHDTTGKRVVILIDEYDKPLVDNLENPDLAEANRELLREFYGVIKSLDEMIEFMFLTGVSKYTKVSIFSGLNQITDITLSEEYATICGYTQAELEDNFSDHLARAAEKTGLDKPALLVRIKEWYNGYSWDGRQRMYNPFAILCFLDFARFRNYWFETGTPDHLIKIIKKHKYDLETFDSIELGPSGLESSDLRNPDLKSLLFQTGYLTVEEVVLLYGVEKFRLCVPNFEVRNALYSLLFSNLADINTSDASKSSFDLIYSLSNGDVKGFKATIEALFARIPANLYIEEERYYHSLFVMMMYMSGIKIESEINTNIGRIDGIIELEDNIYIIELKYSKSPSSGIKQIKEKKYHQRYANSDKTIVLLAVSFNRQSIAVESEIID